MRRIDDICRFFAGVDDDLDVPDWGWCPWMVCTCHEEAMQKIWLKSFEFKGIKNSLKDR